jgi:Zn-dependent protease
MAARIIASRGISYNAAMLGLSVADLIIRAITLVVAFTVHEFAHAFVADRFGDDTPRRQGRLTLNPLVHLDPLGSLMLILAGFGWARPVEVNPYQLQRRSPAAPMLVALAGPVSNILLALLAAIPVRAGLVSPAFSTTTMPSGYEFFINFAFINILLALFNLIPLFPLDGEKILHYFLPPSGKAALENVRQYGSIILIVLVVVLPRTGFDFLETLIFDPATDIARFLLGI